jgi:drug/metabolite transporter (DMT)-like permease
MEISREEAQEALGAIEDATKTSRALLRSWIVGIFVVGVIWTISFAASQFLPDTPLWSLGETFLVGIAFAIYWGRRRVTAIRVAPQSRLAFLYTRLAVFYGILYLFFLLWQIALLRTAMESALLWITVIMFAAIITGVWLREPVLIGCGVAVTVLSTLGYWLIPQYFWLWVAIFAGLPLIAVSVYLWRRR